MRMRWCLGAAVVCSMAAAACGSDGADSADDSTTSVPVTTAATPTTVATTVGPTTTVTATTTTTPTSTTAAGSSTTVAEAPGAAEVALADFLLAFDEAADRLVDVTARVDAEIEATGIVSEALFDEADAAGSGAFLLTRLVPAGLDPSVYEVVHAAVFTMGQAAGAYLYAPGWAPEEWPDWSVGMEAAQAQLPTMRERVEEAAAESPEMTAVAPGSREDAAHAVLELELIRTFGHGGPGLEVDPVPAAVRWIGALPAGAVTGADCAFDMAAGTPRVPTGDFVDGVGGCALVFYDGDVDGHEDEIAAWQADPTQPPSGEFVAFIHQEGGFTPVGSAE